MKNIERLNRIITIIIFSLLVSSIGVNISLYIRNTKLSSKVISNKILRTDFLYSINVFTDNQKTVEIFDVSKGKIIREVRLKCYEIEYCFEPSNRKTFIEECLFIAGKVDNFILPVEKYEYKIYSTNNSKGINKEKSKNFNISLINAERDTFSENDNSNSYKLISSLIEKSLSSDDRVMVEEAYNKFFSKIQDAESFKSVFNNIQENQEFENMKEIINKMQLIPNFPNLKNIFTNINIGYGDEFL